MIPIRVRWQGAPIGVGEALELCRTSEAFRAQLIATLAAGPYAAYFWETPPIAKSTLDRAFEFVLIEAAGLAHATPDANAFREHFARDEDRDGVVLFENQSRDATLIAPCPLAPIDVYSHLAAFLRGAPEAQKHALFRCIGEEVLARAAARPLWLSTAGTGVYWLHVRLDSRPKYYRHVPYATGA